MYLARLEDRGRTRYLLRESYAIGKRFTFRDLFDLGSNPERFIVYPGGNAYYIDATIEDDLNERGIRPDGDALEDLFWAIEEYKVSLFAQELKTAIPISRKRLDKKLKEIQRMV